MITNLYFNEWIARIAAWMELAIPLISILVALPSEIPFIDCTLPHVCMCKKEIVIPSSQEVTFEESLAGKSRNMCPRKLS